MKQSADTSSRSDASNIKVNNLRLRDTRRAHQVFTAALLHHFDHFDEPYRQAVLADNTLVSMARAALHPERVFLVAKDEDQIIGYVIASVPKDKRGQIYWLFVDPDYRGQNLGLTLLSRALRVMTAKGAHTATLVTHDHTKYYARQGFRLIEKIPDGKYTKYVLSYDLNR